MNTPSSFLNLGPSEVARLLNENGVAITPQAVSKWKRTNRIPAERVIDVERATGIPRQKLRPDIYPAEAAA